MSPEKRLQFVMATFFCLTLYFLFSNVREAADLWWSTASRTIFRPSYWVSYF